MKERLPDTFGDRSKRTCEFYACCQNLKTVWEDETGAQEHCEVCGCSVWASFKDDADVWREPNA